LERIYKGLIENSRLLLPARVIREFGNNRGKNLAEIYKRLKQKENSLDKVETKNDFFPILENEEEYIILKKNEADIKEIIKKSREAIKTLQSKVSNYNWNDPVSQMYKDVFSEEIIIEAKKSKEALIEDLNFRIEHKIAPGYNDSGKSDKGIGDLIIWQTILEIGKDLNKDVIFVTDDSKNDWFYIEEKKTIYPKFELFDEFRRISNNTIHIIDITTFLEIQEANEDMIKEVQENKILDFINYSEKSWYEISHLDLRIGMVVSFATTSQNEVLKHNIGEVLAIEQNDLYDNIIVLKRANEQIQIAGKNFIWRVQQ
jgi:PIN like domain